MGTDSKRKRKKSLRGMNFAERQQLRSLEELIKTAKKPGPLLEEQVKRFWVALQKSGKAGTALEEKVSEILVSIHEQNHKRNHDQPADSELSQPTREDVANQMASQRASASEHRKEPEGGAILPDPAGAASYRALNENSKNPLEWEEDENYALHKEMAPSQKIATMRTALVLSEVWKRPSVRRRERRERFLRRQERADAAMKASDKAK